MSRACALLLTNDPLEAYERKYGAIPDEGALSPGGVFARVVVVYQAARGGTERPRTGLIVYRVRALRAAKPAIARALAFAVSFAWFALRAGRIARRERVDLIRAYNPFVQGAVAVLAARLARRPCVVAVHTDPAEILARLDRHVARVFARLERFALARANRIWCLTEYLRGMAIARGAPSERVRVLPNRVPVAVFAAPDPVREASTRARYGIPPDAPVVVSVARLDPEKDPLTLVRAFTRVPSRAARLVFVGDGELRSAVEEEARRSGLDGRIVVTGFRPRSEIPSFLHLADCFVLASRYEGFPFALTEALAAGVPVIASDARQLDDLLEGTGAGRFPAGDADALAARIATVLRDRDAARNAARAGRTRVACFDRDAVDAIELSLYREILGALEVVR